ncbi:MAG: penicillin-binding transpeptidase domain-containing protein [Candidatus Limiplasma sp.]|nr:penicillin-binding transpeptidase domain-containing protein [Candidatus Limiplasma sp.]
MPAELHIRKRVLTLLVILIFLFGILACRIAYLTTARSAELTSRGVRQWTREGTVYARRGNILDTNGQTLVMSATAYIVSVEPGKVRDAEAFARIVSPILGLSEEKVAEKAANRGKSSVTLKRQVSRETADRLRQLKQSKDAETAEAASALLFDEDVRRVYLRGAFLTQTLGLVNVDGVGQSGLEQQYETLLRGEAGRSMRSVDGKARPIYDSGNLYIEPQDGSTVRLTIDATIQEIVEKAMRECYEVNKAQAVHAIAMDVYTGAVLAMCSKPDYDPNDPPRDQMNALQSLMRIRLISDSYEPGSTFKILTAAAALDSGVTAPEDGFYCSGKIKVDGDTIKCWGNPHKAETMAQALQNSCNPVFVELALRMGTERFYQYLHAFGLGSKTHIDLQGEESGILIPVNSVKNVDLARIGFGQSVAVTPVQLLTAACSVINGGRLMRPYLLKEAVSPDGTVLYRTSPKVVSTPISEETSLTMRKLLEDVVAIGGAKNARIPGYRIGGKTGTAQVYKEGRIVRNVHIGSFLGFAPADDPRIALLVIVDEADTPVDYGGTTAAPFARQILADVLPYLGYQPDGDDGSEPVQVADVIGLPLWEARKTLSALGLKVLDDGGSGSVTAQMPSAGAKLRTGGQMMLYTYEEALPETETLVCVPDVSGKSIASAASLLRQRGLEMEIDGSGFAVSQEPAAGSFLAPDSVVLVHFELPNP